VEAVVIAKRENIFYVELLDKVGSWVEDLVYTQTKETKYLHIKEHLSFVVNHQLHADLRRSSQS
jgi:hypothetical protein